MSDWEKVKIEDLIEIVDYRGKTPEKSDVGILTLSAKSVKTNFIDYSKAYYISEETYKKFMVRGFPEIGDVLITTEAPMGCVAQLERNDVAIAQRLLLLKGKKDILDNRFMKYYLQSEFGQSDLRARETGTTVIGIKQSEFRKILFPNAPLDEQKAIADVLSALDDKIELNNKINKNLEEQAQALFKHWFVDFEFPNENGEPYKSSGGEMKDSELGLIPKDWEVIALSEIADVINGYSYKGSELQSSKDAMATIKNFNRNGGFKLDGFKEIIISDKVKDKHFINEFDIVVAHTDLTQNADVIGNAEMIMDKSYYNRVILSMDLVKVVPQKNKINIFFLFAVLSLGEFKQYAMGFINGTTVLHLSKLALPTYKVALPNNLKSRAPNIFYENIYKNISLNIKQNQKLTAIRDSLLPKLMSGELRVNN